MSDILRLDIWKGDWGLPSVDISCLHVLAYAKFGGVPMRINATNNPFRTPNGQLPVLHTNVGTLDTTDSIIEFFREAKYDPDNKLTPQQCAEITAYSTMLKEKLFPALQFVWWIDPKNMNEFTRPWYCEALPFPLHFYYPRKYEQQVKDMMEILYPLEDNLASIENKVYSEAQKCMTLLSTRLGTSEFFLGSNPTSLDAIIYSYLAPLLKAPLPNPALQNHLKACTNLVKFISRISQRYFENEYRQYEKLKSKENAQKPHTDPEDDFPNKRRNQFLAGIFATTAMVTYALSTGILKVPIKDDDLMDIPTDYLDDQDVDEE